MALSLTDSLFTWQNVKASMASLEASSVAQAAFKALKERLAGVGGNPNLQFVPITGADIEAASGKIVADAATKVYGIYFKKTDTATAAYVSILDDASDDTGIATDVRAVLPFLEAEHEVFAIDAKGIAMAAGVVAKAYTDWDGTTNSTAGDAPNGFIILGAA